MNTGQGRLAAGIQNSIASVSDEEIQKWLRGEPNDITKDGKAATVGFLVGLLMGNSPERAISRKLNRKRLSRGLNRGSQDRIQLIKPRSFTRQSLPSTKIRPSTRN